MAYTVAIIGSFRRHYDQVLTAWKKFTEGGLLVTSPLGSTILEEGIPFVRFASDPEHWDDPLVQTVALHRILRADFVYVIAPGGYVGRTTCYEIGRVIQAGRPLYFSDIPQDLPIRLPAAFILSIDHIVDQIQQGRPPCQCLNSGDEWHSILEYELVSGKYRKDDELA